MKGKILILAVLLLGLGVVSGGTAAYFSAEGTARNVITAGDVQIALEERHIDGSGAVVEFPIAGVHGVMPGSSVSKLVSVKNTAADAWIRVRVSCAATAADGSTLPADAVSIWVDEESWLLKDGWYYCRQAIPTGEATPVLFDRVEFSPAMGNRYQNSRVVVTVQAQAVQSAHNGASVEEAAGWPAL